MACGLTAIGSVVVLGYVAVEPVDRRYKDAGQREIAARQLAVSIELERAADSPEWAGTYFRGSGRGGESISLAPGSGFATVATGCIDILTNCGEVKTSGALLELAPRFEPERYGAEIYGDRLMIVPWGARRYLVPLERLDVFVSDINLGRFETDRYRWAPADARWLALERTRHEPLVGAPQLPPEHAAHILATPIDGIVLGSRALPEELHLATFWRDYELELDRGSADGMWIGMRIALLGPRGLEDARVVAVSEHGSIATVRAHGEHRAVRTGSEWSTRDRTRD